MNRFKLLSFLLLYPEPPLKAHLDEVADLIGEDPCLSPLLTFFRTHSLIELQQNYVATFDQNPSHSLHLFEHVHGESRDRGQAMVDLLNEYRRHGFDIDAIELPDYVPLFLEFLAQIPQAEALALLGEAIDVLAAIGGRLADHGSPYHVIFAALEQLSPVPAQALALAPIRDMDEAMETFGPRAADGTEPLLTPQPQVAVVQMLPSRRPPAGADPTGGR